MVFISPSVDVLVFSFFIILVINFFYKILVDQKEAKAMRERMKQLNEKMKEEQKKGSTEKVNKMLDELMQENGRMMKMSLKPMIVSFIIVLLALPWVADNYGDRVVKLTNNTGYLAVNEQKFLVQKTDSGVQVNGAVYNNTQNGAEIAGSKWNIESGSSEVKFSRIVAYLPFALPFVGSDLGWLGWYFITAILFMIVTRKFMKIYM